MTFVRNRSFVLSLLSALVLLCQAPAVLAHDSATSVRPFEVDFDKCFDRFGDAPYLVTFSGTVSGDVSGTVEARIAALTENVEPNQNYLQADYVVRGTLNFTAPVGGRYNARTNRAVLRGYVSEGPAWLIGAGVLDEFRNYVRNGTNCSRGTLYITPRWTQSRNDDDND